MLPADVIWIDFKYNFLTAYFLWRENLYSLYQKPDDSNGVAKSLVVEFPTMQNQITYYTFRRVFENLSIKSILPKGISQLSS